MHTDYDVIVAGLGAMGSAAAYHLAAKGKRVLGLDRFQPPHNQGSSHGLTRIIREAYFEHPLYVPLVQRAYELWAGLERDSGKEILVRTGGLMIGAPGGVLVSGSKRSAREHNLPHQILSAAELRCKYPVLEPTAEMVGVWEPRAGILFPEVAIQAHLNLAAKHGAQLRYNEPLLDWKVSDGAAIAQTVGHTYRAKRLLLSAGAWMSQLVPDLGLPLAVERQVLFWFEPCSNREAFSKERCPIHLWEYAPQKFFYGFPDLGDGVKVAVHHQGEAAQADSIRREPGEQEEKIVRDLLQRHVPTANGKLKSAAVCLYTNTPDEHFILDYHPVYHKVVIASPCSGHGFKFSSAIGEIVSDLLDDRKPRFDLSLFKIARFL